MNVAYAAQQALFAEIGRESDCGAPVNAVLWAGPLAAFAAGDGTVRFRTSAFGDAGVVEAHRGAALCAAVDLAGSGVVSGGDDGRLVHSRSDGSVEVIAETGGKWIEHVAVAPWGALAWGYGRMVEGRIEGRGKKAGVSRLYKLPTSCGGLAFAPKGQRLAIAHYGGVTLHWITDEKAEPTRLVWKGSHIALTWSPDGRFLMTAMQESAIHGWRLADKNDMQMSGFPAKPRSFSWNRKGDWLATSGAPAAVCWPFKGKDGPMGKDATERGTRSYLSTAVAFHPRSDTIAVGYASGEIAFVRLSDDLELTVRPRGGRDAHPIAGLAWSADGRHLAFGTEGGGFGLIDAGRWSKT
jgi:WD40 repeat protein